MWIDLLEVPDKSRIDISNMPRDAEYQIFIPDFSDLITINRSQKPFQKSGPKLWSFALFAC